MTTHRLRTLLFLPGNAPNLLIHGETLGADAVIYDLEDAVAPTEKDAARILVRNALRQPRRSPVTRIVRINGLDSPFWRADLEAIVPERPDFIMPPKLDSALSILQIASAIADLERAPDSIALLPLIETALGVERALDIATASPRVQALLLGGEDLAADLQCKRTKAGAEIAYARGRLVSAARAAGISAIDTPFTDVDDLDGLAADASLARSLGFSGKALISPRHVLPVNDAFSPTPAEIDYALDVLEAITQAKAQGKGVVALRGKMIDAPVVKRARQTLAYTDIAFEEGLPHE